MASFIGTNFLRIKFMRLLAGLLIFMLMSSDAWASKEEIQVKQANELFKKQQWDSAIDGYLNVLEGSKAAKNTDILQYDLGSAFYKKRNYDQSIEHLQKSLSDKNKNLSSKSYYNLGNALYRKGQSLENSKVDEAIGSLQKSVENYDHSLRLNPRDKDAQYNQKFVEKELERLKKKKQEQQNQQQQQDQSKQDQSQQKQNNSQGSQNNQNQQQQPSQKDKEQQEQKEKQQEEQAKKDQQSQAQQSQSQQNQAQKKSGQEQQGQGAEEQQQSLEQKQAKELLEEYESQDAPKGLLNFVDRHRGDHDVDKDW